MTAVEEGYASVDVASLSVDQLDEALWRVAAGDWKAEAAILLLTFHGHWSRRDAFRRYVTVEQEEGDPSGPLWATVDWAMLYGGIAAPYDPNDRYQQLSQSSSRELRILRIAASLQGAGGVSLADALDSGFDDTNARLVQAAVVHAMRGMQGSAHLWPERL